MTKALTIQIPDDSGRTLEELGRRRNRSAEEVAQEILERTLAVVRLRDLRRTLQADAEAGAFQNEDDILDAIS